MGTRSPSSHQTKRASSATAAIPFQTKTGAFRSLQSWRSQESDVGPSCSLDTSRISFHDLSFREGRSGGASLVRVVGWFARRRTTSSFNESTNSLTSVGRALTSPSRGA